MKVKKFYAYRTAIVQLAEGYKDYEKGMICLDSMPMTMMWQQVLKDNGYQPDNHIVFVVEDKGYWKDTTKYIVKLSDWKVTIYDGNRYKVKEGRF